MMDGGSREDHLQMIKLLTGEIRGNPQNTEALTVRALLYDQLGEHRLAVEDNSNIIALEPNNAVAYVNRANAYVELGEQDLAVADYDAAIRLAPGDAVAHYSRGACRAELGHLAGAVTDFDVAVLLVPGDAAPYYGRSIPKSAHSSHILSCPSVQGQPLAGSVPKARRIHSGPLSHTTTTSTSSKEQPDKNGASKTKRTTERKELRRATDLKPERTEARNQRLQER